MKKKKKTKRKTQAEKISEVLAYDRLIRLYRTVTAENAKLRERNR
jgi:hypothetical protein